MIFTALIVLLGIHFMYHIDYNPLVREVMELFQEKLFAISLSLGRKISVAYSNLYRSFGCVEDKLSSSNDDDMIDEGDATQAFREL